MLLLIGATWPNGLARRLRVGARVAEFEKCIADQERARIKAFGQVRIIASARAAARNFRSGPSILVAEAAPAGAREWCNFSA
jgi:hypothetical protein